LIVETISGAEDDAANDSVNVPAPAVSEAPKTSNSLRSLGARLMLDRSAVLVVGLVTGFLVGASFGTHTPTVVVSDVGNTRPITTTTASITEAPIDARVVSRVAAGRPFTVGVFGDSFGVGVWAGLYPQLTKEQGFEVLKLGKESTGFTRYQRNDPDTHAREQLAHTPLDVAVISFGANDVQPFYAEGHWEPFMSPVWRRVVSARIDHFVGVARSTGAAIIWIGLPAMRDPTLDAAVQQMNALFAERMHALGGAFFDTRPLSVDASGHYTAQLPDASGRLRQMRTPDGLHMIGIGYQRITAGAAEQIRALATRARSQARRSANGNAAATD
jgi:hypothetical protein